MSCFFIAGATGYTGRALVNQLIANGQKVVAHIRPNSPSKDELKPIFEAKGIIVDLSPWNEFAIADAIKKHAVTHVASLLGTTAAHAKVAARKGEDASYEAVERDLTIMLLNAAKEQTPKPRFIFLSAMGADKPGNRYMRARTAVETAIFESGLSYLIARPAFITGPDRREFRPLERSAAIVSDGILKLTGWFGGKRFRDSYQSLNSTKIAAGMAILAMHDSNIIADPYLLRHPENAIS